MVRRMTRGPWEPFEQSVAGVGDVVVVEGTLRLELLDVRSPWSAVALVEGL